ncbi:MAG: hypothetical protein NXI04_28555 [Planctomycetaceae bacterium]|nr:hypothetical protein [Planctomycetaceae bacterium]
MSALRFSILFLRVWVILACSVVLPREGFCQRWVTQEKMDKLEIFGEVQLNADVIQQQLNSVRAELKSRLQIDGSNATVQVVVFSSRNSYRSYIGQQIPEAANRRAIFYKNGELYQIYTFRHSDLLTDLRHEYTHALLHQSLPFVPLWIDEGLAEYFEEIPAARSGSSRLRAMRWKCRTGWKPGLSDLERIPDAASMDSDDYRNSWAWVHYLIHESDASRSQLTGYLAAISAGEAPGRFSEWVTQHDPPVLSRVGSYFRRFRFSLR